MVDKICDYLTNKIKDKMPEIDEERSEVINYGIHIIIGELPKFFIFLAIAVLMGITKEFLLTVIIIFPYRGASGGFHLKTHIGCITITTIYYCGIAYISKFYLFSKVIKYILISLIWIFGMIMCKLYAPADTEYMPILTHKERKTKQILSYIFLTITLAIGAVIQNQLISNIIILGMLVQSIMISNIAYKLAGCKYGYRAYIQNQKVNKTV